MTISIAKTSFVVSGAAPIPLSDMIKVTRDSANPPYLVVSGLDRDEYTVDATHTTGSLKGTATVVFSPPLGDIRPIGVYFTYNAASGRYYNAQYGYLDKMVYQPSTSPGDFTEFTVFGLNSSGVASYYAEGAVTLEEDNYVHTYGSIGIVTRTPAVEVPQQATPDGISAIAQSFVGKAWNVGGCWTLAQTIATYAGAPLPVVSSNTASSGRPAGEWMVAFNGPGADYGDWQAMVRTGDVVVFGGLTNHVTTCVAGRGASAMLVDNRVIRNGAGQIANSANDGSVRDIRITGPFAAASEWALADPQMVVIYRLDTPVMASDAAPAHLDETTSYHLSHLYSVSDPADLKIIRVQAYDSLGPDQFLVNGNLDLAHDAAHAANAQSLSDIMLVTGAAAGSDTIMVRAENARGFWGDWLALTETVGPVPRPLPNPLPGPLPRVGVGMTGASVDRQFDMLVQGLAALSPAGIGQELSPQIQAAPAVTPLLAASA